MKNQQGFFAIWIVLGAIVMLGLVGGAFYLGTIYQAEMFSKTGVTTNTVPESSPVDSVVITSDKWAVFENQSFGFKYPATWELVDDKESESVLVRDPRSLVKREGNGGGFFDEYSRIFKVEEGVRYAGDFRTPEQVVNEVVNGWKATNPIIDLHPKVFERNGLQYGIIDAYGQGSLMGSREVFIFNGIKFITVTATINESTPREEDAMLDSLILK